MYIYVDIGVYQIILDRILTQHILIPAQLSLDKLYACQILYLWFGY